VCGGGGAEIFKTAVYFYIKESRVPGAAAVQLVCPIVVQFLPSGSYNMYYNITSIVP
jgi:hypothetical protein